MKEDDLLEFATLITNYIVSKAVPYNIDYPIFEVDSSSFEYIINSDNNYDISDLINDSKNVKEGVIHLDNTILQGFLPENTLNKSIIKIRTYFDTNNNRCILVPIVLLPFINNNDINFIFSKVYNCNAFKCFTDLESKKENMVKLIQYGLSYVIGSNYLNNYNIDYYNDLSEKEIFGNDVASYITESQISLSTKNDLFAINYFRLYNYLGYAYDLLFNKKAENEYIEFCDIVNIIKNASQERSVEIVYASLILDIFIDNGIVVPRIRELNNGFIRLYKFGEVAQLTLNDLLSFTNVLYNYQHLEKRDLDSIEVEKILVVFFKKHNTDFDNRSNTLETFRVCYSKFGPRISSSNNEYSVRQSDALISFLEENKLINKNNNKITVAMKYGVDETSVSNRECFMFAYAFSMIHAIYNDTYLNNKNNYVFKYFSSYNRFLTILSIGNDNKNMVLSLAAELNLIKALKLQNHYKNTDMPLKLLGNIMDGVLSGIWKYQCYRLSNIIEDFINLIPRNKYDEAKLFVLFEMLSITFSDDLKYTFPYIEKLGAFLCDIAIFYYQACKFKNIEIHSDFGNELYYNILFDNTNSKLLELNDYYRSIFQHDNDGVEDFIKNKLNSINLASCNLMDEFRVFLKTSSFNCTITNSCIVLFDYDNTIKIKGLFYYQFNSYLLFPIRNDEEKESALIYLCGLLENSYGKILYYTSYNANIVMRATKNGIYGEIIKQEIHNLIKKYKENNTIIKNELLLYTNKEIKSEFKCREYEFSLTNRINYNNRLIYSYCFRKNKSMIIKNKNGDIYIGKGNSDNAEKEKKMNIERIDVSGGQVFIGDTININDTVIGKNELISDLKKAKDMINDKETISYIDEAINATEKSDNTKFKRALNWLGSNAIDILKSIVTPITIAILENCI